MSADPALATAPAWRAALHALVQARMQTPFTWGRHDCCLFAADAVLATTGVDPAAGLRGSYATEAEAEGLLARLGGLEALADAVGLRVPVLQAGEGDLGLVRLVARGDSPRLLAVCAGGGWVAPGRKGLHFRALVHGEAAWKVRRG